MAMKCVAQIPHPVAAPAHASQVARARPRVAQARWNRLTATTLARKQTRPASTTSRQSCSPVRQVRTRNIVYAHVLDWPPYMDTRRLVFLMLRAEYVGETSLRFDCHDPSLAGWRAERTEGVHSSGPLLLTLRQRVESSAGACRWLTRRPSVDWRAAARCGPSSPDRVRSLLRSFRRAARRAA